MAAVKFAVVDVNDYLTKKQASEPELAADWAKLEEYYNKKLWHQLTLKLHELVKHPLLKSGDNLIQLYKNFLSVFENKINPLSLVELVAHIIEQYQDKKEAVQFLEKIEQKVKVNDEAVTLCKVLQGQLYLENLNDLDSTEKIIEQIESTLEDADGVTPVHSKFYKLASEYYRVRGPISRYYSAALRWAGAAHGSLSAADQSQLAARLSAAALLAPDQYRLHELALHPLMQQDLPQVRALKALVSGDSAALEAARAQCPELQRADALLNRKRAMLRLMEMAFNRTSPSRRLSFAEIAAEARVPPADVEALVMKGLAGGLIRGHIDQVSRCVSIEWVRPRAVGAAGAGGLARRLTDWAAATRAAAAVLEDRAAVLLTT